MAMATAKEAASLVKKATIHRLCQQTVQFLNHKPQQSRVDTCGYAVHVTTAPALAVASALLTAIKFVNWLPPSNPRISKNNQPVSVEAVPAHEGNGIVAAAL